MGATMNESMFLVACFIWQLMSMIVAYFMIYMLLQLCFEYYSTRKRQKSFNNFEAQTLLTKYDSKLIIVGPDVLNS